MLGKIYQHYSSEYPCSTDKRSEAAILEVIQKSFGDHLLLGEEGGVIGELSSDYLWCVDPLGLVLSTLLVFDYLGISIVEDM